MLLIMVVVIGTANVVSVVFVGKGDVLVVVAICRSILESYFNDFVSRKKVFSNFYFRR